MANTILFVEDDAMIASGLCYALEQEGYAVTHCDKISAAEKALKDHIYDLALLDMQLPDGTGFDISGRIKSAGTSVIFLTVVDDEGNIVKAFDDGAEDYITKPFRLRELLARVKAVLGRRSAQVTDKLKLGGITVDVSAGKAFAGDSILELTALEYRLLLVFAANRGQILSRKQILENLWDSAGNFVEDNTLTVYIKRLREKLGGSASIETVRGMGYRAT